MKNWRPEMEPCGTPHLIVCLEEHSRIKLNKLFSTRKITFNQSKARHRNAPTCQIGFAGQSY